MKYHSEFVITTVEAKRLAGIGFKFHIASRQTALGQNNILCIRIEETNHPYIVHYLGKLLQRKDMVMFSTFLDQIEDMYQ